ncbi:MAG: bifunctional adenosylcobinamide kinase/adenosylcobinamide-phosphate guanylyltransferase [Lentisphaeria bacterium]
MPQIILVTGGSRSGKSRYAEQRARALAAPRAYVATCEVGDAEMQERVARHQRDRAAAGWHTLETPLDLAGALAGNGEFATVLVDCLTLWVNNLLFHRAPEDGELTEDAIQEECERVLAAARRRGGAVVFVTNEVGLGIVPDNALARRYRDLVGRCNQAIAAGADEVVLVACGLPLTLKPSDCS